MTGSNPRLRRFSAADHKNWEQLEDRQIFAAEVVDESHGYTMNAAFWRLAEGEKGPVPAPYDEVWVVASGTLAIHGEGGGEVMSARAGEFIYVPTATPGVARAEDDVEVITIAHPPRWEIAESDWERARALAEAPDAPRPQRFAVGDLREWTSVDDQQIYLTYAIDEPQGTAFGAGFGLSRGDVGMDFVFPYDEVTIAVKGGFTIHSEDGEELTIRPGEFVYMPTGSAGRFVAAGATEMVFVHFPTYEKAVARWPSDVPLRPEKARPATLAEVWR